MTKTQRTNAFFLGLVVFYLFSCFFLIPLIPDKFINYNSNVILGQLLIIVPVVLYLICTEDNPLKELKFRRIGVLNTILLIVFTYCMLPVVSLVNTITMMFTTNIVSVQLDSMSQNSFWLNLFLVAVLPAVVEEMTFRGVIYSGYKNCSIRNAMFASALIFGLFHMNINQFCYAFIMGIVFVLIREATGSMHSSMIVHFIFNANSIVMLKILDVVTKYANKMADSDEKFAELSDSLSQTNSETITTYADYSLTEKLATIISLLVVAIIAGVIGFIILKVIAERCNRSRHFNIVLCSIVGKTPENLQKVQEDEYVEEDIESRDKIIDIVFCLGVLLCVLMMIYVEVK